MEKRDQDGDQKVLYYRSPERFVRVDGKWWFQAREGDQGPYNSRDEAEREAALFIASMQMQSEQAARDERVDEHTERPAEGVQAPDWELMIEPK